MTDTRPTTWGVLAALWGLIGVLGLLGRALVTLTPKAVEAVSGGLTGVQWAALIAWVAFMAYTEGYRGFQQRFSPMASARLLELLHRPTLLRGLLAPAFAMGLLHGTRRRLALSWGVLLGVIGLVIAVRFLPQPWRGIVDAGVVVGLAWGSLSLIVATLRAVLTGTASGDPQLTPGPTTPAADDPLVEEASA